MVIGGLMTPPNVPGAYGVFLPAKSVIEGKQRTTDGKTVDETWQLTGEDGSPIEVELHMCAVHRRAARSRPRCFRPPAGLQRQLEFAAAKPGWSVAFRPARGNTPTGSNCGQPVQSA
jgi:hypothetical protein